MLSKQIEKAQKKVEEQNFLIRKRVLEYDDVMNEQRRVVYRYRDGVLEGESIGEEAREQVEGVLERTIAQYTPGDYVEDWDLDGLFVALGQFFPVDLDDEDLAPDTADRDSLTTRVGELALERYNAREADLGEELMGALERFLLLQTIDERWQEHLFDMDYLREGIHLRGFAQIDPLVAYKNEAFDLFGDLMNSIWADYTRMIFNVQVNVEGQNGGSGPGGAGGHPIPPSPPAAAPPSPPASHISGGTSAAGAGALAAAAAAAGEDRRAEEGAVMEGGAQAVGRRLAESSVWWTTSTRSVATTPAGVAAARSSRSATAPDRGVVRERGACIMRRFSQPPRSLDSVSAWPRPLPANPRHSVWPRSASSCSC